MGNINENYFKTDNNEMQKNQVEDILDGDEKILERLKPNRKALIWSKVFNMLPFVLIWLLFDGGFIFSFFNFGFFEKVPTYVYLIVIGFFAVHLTPVWIWIAGIVKAVIGAKNIEYVFTDKRIIVRSGLIGIDFKSIFYSEIIGVNLKVGLSDKVFKVGDIYITSISERVVLNDISNPYIYQTKLQKIIHDIKTDIQYPNDYRPAGNKGYNTKYTGSNQEGSREL